MNNEIISVIKDFNAHLAAYKERNDERFDIIERAVAMHGAPGGGNFSANPSAHGYKNLGEFAQSVAMAMRPGGRIDDRLKVQASASGANETIPSEGGFLVNTDMSNALLKSVFDTAVVARRCNRIPISTNANGIKLNLVDESSRANGSRWGGVQAYWAAEAATVTASKPKFRQANLELRKLMAICYATDELLQDAPALGAVLTQAFTEEIGFKLDDAIINGIGAGMPQGIMQSGCLVTVDAEAGQTSSNPLLIENCIKMFARMPARNRRRAVWFINQDLEPYLYTMSISVGTGGSAVFLPAGGASEEPYSTLFGRPIIPIEQCQTTGTTGDIILADPSMYVLIDKGGIKADASIHLQFLYDEMTFRWVYRCDGMPLLNKPITPFKGSDELSPFVVLATRS